MTAISHAIISAAGAGNRLGRGMPKCLVEVGNASILSYQLYLLRDVPRVSVVTGFKREAVEAAVKALRPDARLPHNPDYATTWVLQSLAIGIRGVEQDGGYILHLDGDIIFEEKAFDAFLRLCGREQRPVLAVSRQITDDPIYSDVTEADGKLVLNGYSRTKPSGYDRVGLSYVPVSWLEYKPIRSYEAFGSHCPLEAGLVDCLEIDTPADLAHAEAELAARTGYCGHL